MNRYRLPLALLLALVTCQSWAGLDEGIAALTRRDYATAYREFDGLAKQGNPVAQAAVGMMYADGNGVPRDYKEAVKWLRLAADQGNSGAQTNLAVMYSKGVGVPQDYKEAEKWLRLAAENGYAGAQASLGMMYLDGQGVLQDYREAERWLRLAAAQGSAPAQTALAANQKLFEAHPVTNDLQEIVKKKDFSSRDGAKHKEKIDREKETKRLARERDDSCVIKPAMSDAEIANCRGLENTPLSR